MIRCRVSGSEDHRVFHALSTKVLLAELRGILGWILLTGEDVDERTIGIFGEVSRDQGGLDELSEGIALHTRVGSEAHHDGIAEPLHIYMITKIDRELSYYFLASDLLGIAIPEVDGGEKAPFAPFLESVDAFLIAQARSHPRTYAIHALASPSRV